MSNRLRNAALVLFLAIPAHALAQTAASDRAAELNDEGKRLWLEEKDLETATEKFRQATALSPKAQYVFNLCYALHQLGKYREARTECEKIDSAQGSDDRLREKAALVLEDLDQKLANAPAVSDPYGDESNAGGTDTGGTDTGGTDTGGTDTGGTDTGGTIGTRPGGGEPVSTGEPGGGPGSQGGAGPGPKPIPGLYQPAKIPDDYSWAIGMDLGFHGSNIGDPDIHNGAGVAVTGYMNFMLLAMQRIGIQIYITYRDVGIEDEFSTADDITILDLGGALYKHIKRNRFYMTPLVGAHVAVMQREDSLDEEAAASLGLRTDLSFSWLFGPGRRHVLSVTPGFNFYLPANGGEGRFVEDNRLDETSVSFSVRLGYTLRFTTPFGHSSLLTLE